MTPTVSALVRSDTAAPCSWRSQVVGVCVLCTVLTGVTE